LPFVRGLHEQGDKLRLDAPSLDEEPPDARHQVESPRASRSRIDHQSVPGSRYELPVGVAVDDDIVRVRGQEASRRGAPELMAVAHVNGDTADLALERLEEPGCSWRISVARDGVNRRNGRELRQHVRTSDVAGMEDQLDTFERAEDVGPNETVGVGHQPEDVSSCLTAQRAVLRMTIGA
jgi:hypothetical protein